MDNSSNNKHLTGALDTVLSSMVETTVEKYLAGVDVRKKVVEMHEQPSSISLRYGKGPGKEVKIYFHTKEQAMEKLNDLNDIIPLAEAAAGMGVEQNGGK